MSFANILCQDIFDSLGYDSDSESLNHKRLTQSMDLQSILADIKYAQKVAKLMKPGMKTENFAVLSRMGDFILERIGHIRMRLFIHSSPKYKTSIDIFNQAKSNLEKFKSASQPSILVLPINSSDVFETGDSIRGADYLSMFDSMKKDFRESLGIAALALKSLSNTRTVTNSDTQRIIESLLLDLTACSSGINLVTSDMTLQDVHIQFAFGKNILDRMTLLNSQLKGDSVDVEEYNRGIISAISKFDLAKTLFSHLKNLFLLQQKSTDRGSGSNSEDTPETSVEYSEKFEVLKDKIRDFLILSIEGLNSIPFSMEGPMVSLKQHISTLIFDSSVCIQGLKFLTVNSTLKQVSIIKNSTVNIMKRMKELTDYLVYNNVVKSDITIFVLNANEKIDDIITLYSNLESIASVSAIDYEKSNTYENVFSDNLQQYIDLFAEFKQESERILGLAKSAILKGNTPLVHDTETIINSIYKIFGTTETLYAEIISTRKVPSVGQIEKLLHQVSKVITEVSAIRKKSVRALQPELSSLKSLSHLISEKNSFLEYIENQTNLLNLGN